MVVAGYVIAARERFHDRYRPYSVGVVRTRLMQPGLWIGREGKRDLYSDIRVADWLEMCATALDSSQWATLQGCCKAAQRSRVDF